MSAFSTWRGEQEEGFVDDFVPEKNLLLVPSRVGFCDTVTLCDTLTCAVLVDQYSGCYRTAAIKWKKFVCVPCYLSVPPLYSVYVQVKT